jgi:hypothetical protein
LTGSKVEEGVILEAVVVEVATMEPIVAKPVEAETTSIAPKLRAEAQGDPQLGSIPKLSLVRG